ncbi:MAG: Membrane-associated zinc metalloprotease [Cytophagales bacterium]|jgi:regulator of sigma E protease|nr:RIP metalloprotease RseP [Bacteroidota bacterium]MBS1980578.1 RIP metalloprotease RseP [Bacteroidota bacterium]WHZ07900.1 MAG: Membrane-associated zinc metalloprotease [Cytophagales bacterium]
MEGLIMTAQLLLSLSILIVVHEWGHFFAARTFNIKVEKFYLFFDFLFPMANVANFALFKKQKGDTEYGIGWFPLGGYVKIAGMVDESMDKEQMKQPPQPWEFRAKPAWQRLIVMLGGIIVNVIVGVLIFIGMTYFIGDKYILNEYVNTHGGVHAQELAQQLGIQTGDKIIKINGKPFEYFDDITKTDALLSQNSYYTVLRGDQQMDIPIPANFIENFGKKNALGKFLLPRRPIVVDEVAKDSIAGKVGLQKGDKIVELNGKPIMYYDELREALKNSTGDSITFKVQRGEQALTFKEYFKGHTNIGFAMPLYLVPVEAEKKISYSIGQSILIGPGRAFDVITLQIKAFGKIFKRELSLKNSLSGPIGMAKMYGGVWDWERFWRMTGLLSMVLAFMNLLPIPALDGGYVLFLLFEMITGKAPSEKFFENAIKVGMALLLLLMVFVFYNDIAKIFTGS